MIWGCFSYSGVGNLEIIETTADRFEYKRIIADNLESSRVKMHFADDFIFQQDNDPKHKSKYVMDFFIANSINVMSWPSQSPDMNPIEHLWDYVKREVRNRRPKNIKELELIVKDILLNIPVERCIALVGSMTKRIKALVKAKGGPTPF